MGYFIGYTDYPTNVTRPDLNGNVGWIQTLLTQNYAIKKPIAIDKEIKGGLHRVKYREQLYLYSYDGIFQERRVEGMLCYVEWENDGVTRCGKYYCLKHYPGLTADDWEEVGSGATVTINNPKTVANLAEREDLEVNQLTGMVTSNLGNTTVNGQGTLFMDELVVGDEIRIGNVEYYYVASIQNQLSLKTTVGTADHSAIAVPIYKVVVLPGDFVNVADARTQAEIDGGVVAPYPASYIWDGDQWLTIYPYGNDPRSHAKNNDTALLILGETKTTDEVWNKIVDPLYRKLYNDATTLKTASQSTAVDTNGNGLEAYSSKLVATELLKRPEVYPTTGNITLFLNQKGQWLVPPSNDPNDGLTPEDFGDSTTTTFEVNEDGKYVFEVIPVGATIIETDYDSLVALRNDGALINGVGYQFDYFTYHQIEYTSEYHMGETEIIVIFANGIDTFATKGISRDYPFDIIEYDIDDTGGLVLPGGIGRPGSITFRHDTLNNLSTHYDFRNHIFRRWAYVIPEYNAATTYTSTSWNTPDWPIVSHPDTWIYAFSGEIGKPLTAAMDPNHDPHNGNFRNPFWKYMWNTTWYKYLVPNPTSVQLGMGTIAANPADYVDLYTFNTNLGVGNSGKMKNIHIGKHTKPNNVVIKADDDGTTTYNNTIGVGSYDSMLSGGGYNYNNNYGTNFCNTIVNEGRNNKIDTNMQNSLLMAAFNDNQVFVQLRQTIGYAMGGNVMYGGISRWITGEDANYNISYANFSNIATAGRFTGNICSRIFSNNHLGDSINSNLFLSFFTNTVVTAVLGYCTFNQWADNNYIYGSMYGCTFKATFTNTTVGSAANRYTGTFNFNQFNGDVTANSNGLGGSRNYFAMDCNYNTFQNYVRNVGSLAIPYKTNNSIYNFAVDKLNMVTTGLSVNRTIFNQELKAYAVAENLVDTMVPEIKGGGLSKVDFIFPEVSLDSFDEVYLDAPIIIKSTTKSDNIASITYQVKEEGVAGGYVTPIPDLQGWITANIVVGDRYWIKAIQTRVVGAVDKGYHTLSL